MARKRKVADREKDAVVSKKQSRAAVPEPITKKKTPAQLRLEQTERGSRSASGSQLSKLRSSGKENQTSSLQLEQAKDEATEEKAGQANGAARSKRRPFSKQTKAIAGSGGTRRVTATITNPQGASQDSHPDSPDEVMDVFKALAVVMAPPAPPPAEAAPSESLEGHAPATREVQTAELPLDWSLKTSARFMSSSSFDWCQPASSLEESEEECTGLQMFVQAGLSAEQYNAAAAREPSGAPDSCCASALTQFQRALPFWVHPEAPVPSSLMTALTASAGRGVAQDQEFLSSRQRRWLAAFQSLYSMFCHGRCRAFYVHGQLSTALFFNGGSPGGTGGGFSACLTRSTRGLRALLAKQDIAFSMPLCEEDAKEASAEDIRELQEFEKSHPGQTSMEDGLAVVDSTPESLVCFRDRAGVDGLYSFLRKFRHLMGPTVGSDEPELLAPVPFRFSSLKAPEVVCRQLHSAESGSPQPAAKRGRVGAPLLRVQHSLELKAALLPPWVIAGVCGVLQTFQKEGFQASFGSEPLTECLNVIPGTQPQEAGPSRKQKEGKKEKRIQRKSCAVASKCIVLREVKGSNGVYFIPR